MRDNKIMVNSSPFVIILSADEHDTLTVRANAARTPYRDLIRARIILAAADGWSNTMIAADLAVHVDTVRKWRRRFFGDRLSGLKDLPRSGRPRLFTAAQVAEVKALACELPGDHDIPLARWSCPDLAVEATRRGVVSSVSASSVRRWLAADAIKPWQHRSWIFPRDPDFAYKAGRVLDLYARTFDGIPLSDDEYVLSADEKPGVQARERIHPHRPPHPGRRPMLVESEYRRHGTLAYLAAYDVHHAQIIGHCAPTTGIEPFTALVNKVMTVEPYASARRVFWVVDNGSSHRGWTAAARLTDAFPNAVMVHTPVHASWLNQVEIYFSVVQRKLLTPDHVASLNELAEHLTAFEARYNRAAQPFDWRFNRDDLNQLLDRIAA
ncbi:MAG TPA: IS630 family transposase [Microlunatus sp.]|nr:IS630 family transposase [Microlunatus sp.]